MGKSSPKLARRSLRTEDAFRAAGQSIKVEKIVAGSAPTSSLGLGALSPVEVRTTTFNSSLSLPHSLSKCSFVPIMLTPSPGLPSVLLRIFRTPLSVPTRGTTSSLLPCPMAWPSLVSVGYHNDHLHLPSPLPLCFSLDLNVC
jgi:hypothetical protein